MACCASQLPFLTAGRLWLGWLGLALVVACETSSEGRLVADTGGDLSSDDSTGGDESWVDADAAPLGEDWVGIRRIDVVAEDDDQPFCGSTWTQTGFASDDLCDGCDLVFDVTHTPDVNSCGFGSASFETKLGLGATYDVLGVGISDVVMVFYQGAWAYYGLVSERGGGVVSYSHTFPMSEGLYVGYNSGTANYVR
jgi:hypothetical protein